MFRTVFANKSISNVVSRFAAPANFQRGQTTAVAQSGPQRFDPQTFEEDKKKLQELLSTELPKPYDGPKRDLVNFPRRTQALYPGKVRMAFLPDEWFQFFYKKTGVTGPYLFGTGLITFLVSKELYVIEHEFSTGCAIVLLAYLAVKKFGAATRQFVDKYVDEENNRPVKEIEAAVKGLEQKIADTKKSVWQAEGQKILMNAKRENVLMQLETEYRRRMMTVYDQVKKRLDYQLDFYNTKRKLEQKHMVNWIVNSVVKSITPQQEKEALQKCIEDLKAISARA